MRPTRVNLTNQEWTTVDWNIGNPLYQGWVYSDAGVEIKARRWLGPFPFFWRFTKKTGYTLGPLGKVDLLATAPCTVSIYGYSDPDPTAPEDDRPW